MNGAQLVAALELELEYEPVPPEQIVAGTPSTGYAAIDQSVPLIGPMSEIGVWEMTVGAMRDTEIDEVFVVIAGDATVEFVSPALDAVELAPGAVVRLSAGMQTVWTVRETLRKIYLA